MTDHIITDERINASMATLKTVINQAIQRGLFADMDDVQVVKDALAIIPQMQDRLHELREGLKGVEKRLEIYEPPVD